MTVDARNGPRTESDDNNVDVDVPVNKKTSFNGQLNQYFHTSKNVAVASTAKSTCTAPSAILDTLKRDSSSQGLPEYEVTADSSSDGLRKRRKRLATTSPTPVESGSPVRMTRSRSASLLQQSPQVLTRSQSANTTTTTTRKRTSRSQPRPPPAQPQPQPHQSLLRDTIPTNLTLLLVGVNPGILTGTTGYAYAHPSNLFWKLLHWSSITPIRHPPSDTYRLPELYNIGNTNIVERPTRDASMLRKSEMDAGVPVLEAKVAAKKPEVVCLVGKSIWEAVWRVRRGRGIRKEEFSYGWQGEGENMGRCEGWDGARVFVATTTSGLAAGMSIGEKRAVWEELGAWVVKRREESKHSNENCSLYTDM